MISVIIIESQPKYQHYFKTMITSDPRFDCVGIYALGKEAIKGILQCKPDIVITEIELFDISGIECIRQAKLFAEDVKFMVCSLLEEYNFIFDALQAGAQAYISKRDKPYKIIDAIVEMYEGAMPVSSSVATVLLGHIPRSIPNAEARKRSCSISLQEDNILSLLSKGYRYDAIADRLNLKMSTLKWHIYNIFAKLQVANRTEAINRYFTKNDE